MYEAARVDDPIYHTSALAGFLIGAIIGIAIIAAASFAFATCGFLPDLFWDFWLIRSLPESCNLGRPSGARYIPQQEKF